jgi:hypothetical protein
MSKLLTDRRIIDGLLEFYADDLKTSMKSGLTGAEFEQPGPQGLVQWLNLCIYKPQVGLVWGGDLAYSQLDLYRPYIARTKLRYAIFAKSLKGKSPSAVKLNVPTFTNTPEFAPSIAVGAAPSLQTLLYVTDRLENFNYIRKNPQCMHAFVGHGESDKHSSSSRLSQSYDFVFAASSASVERFRGSGIDMDGKRFLLTGGWPVEGVEVVDKAGPFKKVLYAPTWEGHGEDRNYSSGAAIKSHLSTFTKNGGELRFRPHPGMGSKMPVIKEVRDWLKQLVTGEPEGKSEDFNWSDVLIADVSGVVNEYLFSGKPIVVPIGPKGDWVRAFIESSSLPTYCYLWPYSEISLSDYLQSIAHDPMKTARMDRRNQIYYGTQSIDDLCGLFEEAVKYCAATQKQYTLRYPKLRQKAVEAAGLFKALPSDPEMEEAVKGIRKGKLVLAA